MAKLPDLNEVLIYKNQTVITRFEAKVPEESHRSEQLFTEMLRYLWLCEKHAWDREEKPDDPLLHFIPIMHEEMRAIDSMWHEFILLTRDYHDFCYHFFGRFIHHEPNVHEHQTFSETQFVESLNLFLNYVYDVLGEEVIRTWFQEHLE